MSALTRFLGFGGAGGSNDSSASGLVQIYPLSLKCADFERREIIATYTKILTDCVTRTQGIPEEKRRSLWNSCVQSESSQGLISMLACAMYDMTDLFVVYQVGVIRRATQAEETAIKADYAKQAKSSTGVYMSFKNFMMTDMLKIYAVLEHCILESLHKSVNIAKAVQIKMNELRATTSLQDAGDVIKQAIALADALREGKDILLDGKDVITTSTPDISPTEKAITFLESKRAYYLGFPLAYISGLQTASLGATGESDVLAVERGLYPFFVSIVQPAVEAIFGVKVTFQSQNFRQLDGLLSALKTFDLVGNAYLSMATMRRIAALLAAVDPETEKKTIDTEAAAAEKEGQAAGGSADDVQSTALNGAQIASLVEIVTAVAGGTMPRDSGVQIVMQSFPNVDQAGAEKLLGTAGKGFKPTAAPAPKPGAFG